MKDEGSLTAKEYAEIYGVLNDYCVAVLKNKGNDPFYIQDVKKVRVTRILKILDKMKKRMDQFHDKCRCC